MQVLRLYQLDSEHKISKIGEEENKFNAVIQLEQAYKQQQIIKQQNELKKEREKEKKEREREEKLREKEERERLKEELKLQKAEEKKKHEEKRISEMKKKEEEKQLKKEQREEELRMKKEKKEEEQEQKRREKEKLKEQRDQEQKQRTLEKIRKLEEEREQREREKQKREAECHKRLTDFFIKGTEDPRNSPISESKATLNDKFSELNKPTDLKEEELEMVVQDFRAQIFPKKEVQFTVFLQEPDFSYSLKKKGILVNHFNSCCKFAGSKENMERSAHLSLVHQVDKDDGVINYVLDSEEEFEDKFGENLENSEQSVSDDEELKNEEDSFIIDDNVQLSDYENEEAKIEGPAASYKSQQRAENYSETDEPSSEDQEYTYQIIKKEVRKPERRAETLYTWQEDQEFTDLVQDKIEKGLCKLKRRKIVFHNFWIIQNSGSAAGGALIDPQEIASRLKGSQQREKRSEKVLKYIEEIGIDLHGNFISRSKFVDAFYEKHPECTKSSIENLVTRLAVYELREGAKKKRWFLRPEEIEKLSISVQKMKEIENKKLAAYMEERQAQAQQKKQNASLEKEKEIKLSEIQKPNSTGEENPPEKAGPAISTPQKVTMCHQSSAQKMIESRGKDQPIIRKENNGASESKTTILNFFKKQE